MTATVSRRILVRGRVQGVGFRYFALRQAQRLGVFGWVLNQDDGDLELHVEGQSESVAEFIRQLRRGPSFAWVTDLLESPAPFEAHTSFTIRR